MKRDWSGRWLSSTTGASPSAAASAALSAAAHSSPSGPARTSACPGARTGSGPAADATSERETLAGGVRLCDWVRSHESDLCDAVHSYEGVDFYRVRNFSPQKANTTDRPKCGIILELCDQKYTSLRSGTSRRCPHQSRRIRNYGGIMLELCAQKTLQGGEARKKGCYNSATPFGWEPNGKWNYDPQKWTKSPKLRAVKHRNYTK